RIADRTPPVPTPEMLYFIITGEGAPLPSGENGEGGPQNTYQVFQAASRMQGRHNLRFGGEYLHLRDNRTPGETPSTQRNRGQFCDLQGFVDGVVCAFQLPVIPGTQALSGSPVRHY